MNTEILGSVLQIVALVVLSYPLGRYIAKVYKGERTWLDFMAPVEKWMYKICGIDPNEEMGWKKFLFALLTVNVFWFFWGMVLLVCQGWLPLNPDGNAGQSPDLAFNTCISFMVNCNLQHYSGESGLTYFTQLFVIMLFQFITAGCGMAALAGMFKAMAAKTTRTIGNFWVLLVKSCTRILFPLSLIVGFILILNGTPMGFDGKMELTTLEGAAQTVSQGPTAAISADQAIGYERRRIFRSKLFTSFGKSDFPYQYGGVLVDSDHSDGYGFCIRFLYQTEKVGLYDLRSNVGGLFGGNLFCSSFRDGR